MSFYLNRWNRESPPKTELAERPQEPAEQSHDRAEIQSGHGLCSPRLPEDLLQQFVVVAHDQAITDPHRGRTQLARAAEQQVRQARVAADDGASQHRVIRAVAREVEALHLPALRDQELAHALEEREGLVAQDRGLVGVLNFPVGNALLRKELLRPLAARSTGAVVPPGEVPSGHGHSSWTRS